MIQQDRSHPDCQTKPPDLGILLGGAVGDALGAAIEFDSLERIERFGQSGLTDYALAMVDLER